MEAPTEELSTGASVIVAKDEKLDRDRSKSLSSEFGSAHKDLFLNLDTCAHR